MSIEKIFPLVEKELQAIEAEMTRNLMSEIVMIPTVSKYLISSGGKRFRPMLLILCAKLCTSQPACSHFTPNMLRAAASATPSGR